MSHVLLRAKVHVPLHMMRFHEAGLLLVRKLMFEALTRIVVLNEDVFVDFYISSSCVDCRKHVNTTAEVEYMTSFP